MYPLRPLKVLFTNYYPYSNNECQRFPILYSMPGCARPGILSEIIGYIGKKGKYEIIPYVVRHGDGNQETLREALGQEDYPFSQLIRDKVVDTLAIPMQATRRAEEHYDFSHHIYRIRSSLVVHRPDLFGTNYWKLFSMYDALIWQILGSILFLQCIFGLFVRHIERKQGVYGTDSVGDTIWKTVRIQFFQAEKLSFHFRAGNISLLVFSLFQCTFVFGIFASYLLHSMINPSVDLSYTRLDRILDDIRHGKRELISMNPHTWFEERITMGATPPFDRFKEAMGPRKIRVIEDQKKARRLVRYLDAVMFFQEDEEVTNHIFAHCEFIGVGVELPKLEANLVFRKNFSGLNDINTLIKENIQEIYNIKRRYIEGGRRKQTICSHFKLGDPMKLVSYVGVLIVCISLLGMGAVILFSEILTSRYHRRFKSRNDRERMLIATQTLSLESMCIRKKLDLNI